MMAVDFLFRWAHVLFGITWIGLLYYFNFIQGEYFKEAEAPAKADAMKKLAPRALWWFRWGAMFTFLTGLVLIHRIGADMDIGGQPVIWVGALAGIFMFLNVWLIIWPQSTGCSGYEGGRRSSVCRQGGSGFQNQYAVLRAYAVRHARIQAPVY